MTETRVGNTSCQRPPGSKQLSRGQETSFEMLGPPRAQLLKCQRLAFPHFSFPEFYKNAKTIGRYLRTEGEGYCRLEQTWRFQCHDTNPHDAIFPLYERIWLWARHGPHGDVRATFSPAALLPHLPLNLSQCCAHSPCVEFDVHSRGEEHLACDRQWVGSTAEHRISQGQFRNQQKMSLFIYHLIYQFYQLLLDLYIIWKKKKLKTCLT